MRPLAELGPAMAAMGRTANQIPDPELKKASQQAFQQAMNELGRQAIARSLLRDLYSPDQLREKMTWFWFNHFNVHMAKADIRATIADYEDHALRPHALGRFRDLLGATATHPAMLQYLDNAANAKGHLNENYAREIMELHTMGVGSGYTQEDVQELARILTGVGVNFQPPDAEHMPKVGILAQPDYIRNGVFEFNPGRHDYSIKHFLGHTIEGRGFAEVNEALDILARHPATATYVSRKIATFFVSDAPPDALVRRMAEAFRSTDGDIAKVLLVMFKSPEFTASLQARDKYKDAMQFVLSALRLAYDGKVILNPAPIQGWLNRLGQGLYNHPTPDGYPLMAAAWNSSGQMTTRFEIARQSGPIPAACSSRPCRTAPNTPHSRRSPARSISMWCSKRSARRRARAPQSGRTRPACSSRPCRTAPNTPRSRRSPARSISMWCSKRSARRRAPRSTRRARRRNGTHCSCRPRSSCDDGGVRAYEHRPSVSRGNSSQGMTQV